MFQTEHLQEKWQPVLEHPDLPKIEDSYKRAVTTLILENQEKAMKEDPALRAGLNVCLGAITHAEVAKALGKEFTPAEKFC